MPHSTTDTIYILPTSKPSFSASSKPLTTSSLFSVLPPELRLQIYTHCPPSPHILELQFFPPSETSIAIYTPCIPVLLHLTSESRSFAHYHYILSLKLWFSPLRDSFCLRINASPISSPDFSAWVEKMWNMLGLTAVEMGIDTACIH